MTTKLWNNLPNELRQEPNHKLFKKGLPESYKSPRPNLYLSMGSKQGNRLHTQIRLHVSDLNEHRKKLGKADSPKCECGALKESTEHFILDCPRFNAERAEQFEKLSDVFTFDPLDLPPQTRVQMIINGPRVGIHTVRQVANAFQCSLHQTQRFVKTHKRRPGLH